MSTSSRLGLPYLVAAQAQKHVTVNESLLRLDAVTQLSAISATIATQPSSPADGDIYILPAGKTGYAWGAMANGALAYYRDGVWEELTPKTGWRCLAIDSQTLYVRNASAWWSAAANNERRMLFTPGGDGVVSIYRIETTRVQNPRTATISSISGDTITLTTSDAGLFFNNALMASVSYARIWNTAKDPDQSAWVKAQPAANQLQVVSAASLSGWTAGEAVQIGDPTDQTPNRCVALDISPMLQNVLGRVFRQSGVLAKVQAQAAGVQGQSDLSEAGVSGSFQTIKSFTDGTLNVGQIVIPCSQLSPISNSNLVFFRESVAGAAMGIASASVVAVLV
jgi:WD40 repeat protein